MTKTKKNKKSRQKKRRINLLMTKTPIFKKKVTTITTPKRKISPQKGYSKKKKIKDKRVSIE